MLPTSAFGEGSGPVFLDNVMCTGRESLLLSCVNTRLEMNNCGHEQDAGIACMAGKNMATESDLCVLLVG